MRNDWKLGIPIGPVVEQSTEHIKQIFDINTVSIMRICSAVVPIMAQRHSGTIVNIGSVVGEMYVPKSPLPVLINY